MQANKLTKILLTAGLVFSMQSQATDVDLGLNFTTIADVAITQNTALDFGSDLAVAQGSACTMLVNGTAVPSEVDAQLAVASAAGAHSTYANLSGNCDSSAKGTPGVFTITGAPGLSVGITLNPLNGTNLTFAPAGVASLYNNTANGDTFAVLTSGSAGSSQFASAADVAGRTAGGFPNEGEIKLFVGGVVTAKTTLNTSQTYTEQFVIDANYD